MHGKQNIKKEVFICVSPQINICPYFPHVMTGLD